MTDSLTLRILIIATVALLLVVLWLVMRRPRPLRLLEAGTLTPGIHLFTAGRCRGCEELRASLTDAVGAEGFVEHPEEKERDLFAAAGIDMIPVVVAAREGSRPSMWKDVPPRRVLEQVSRHR